MSSQIQPQTRPRSRNAIARFALIIPLIIVLGCILGPVIYAVALTSKRAHQTSAPTVSTSAPATLTFPTMSTGPATTVPGSCRTDSDCATWQVCVTGFCTNRTTTSGPPSTATTSTSTTRTTTSSGTTSRTSTPTASTTHVSTTSGRFATCQECSLNAQLGSCASEYSACLANTYNCPVLCYGTFQLNGNPPLTCTNGFIPEWPPLRDCICRTASYTCGNVCTGCAYTTVTTAPGTTPAPPVCQACFDSAVTGPCSAQASACYANPTGSCALVCAPYYRANLFVFPGCDNVTHWPPLASCLCPYCGNNQTCTENTC